MSRRFIEEIFGLEFNPFSTQIEPYDSCAELFNSNVLLNNILLDMCKDMWAYISLGYFKLKVNEKEVGSSTMPHKVNPIDFENGEGNLGLSNALFSHFSNKLTQSRFQRDLSDSTVIRNLGSAFSYSEIAYKSIIKGLNKVQVNKEFIENEINQHWELLSEPVQTVLRIEGYENPYELLKEMTRGKTFDKSSYVNFVSSLNIPKEKKNILLNLTPKNYIGKADFFAENIFKFLK
jgi:adenylosuccinate lyase